MPIRAKRSCRSLAAVSLFLCAQIASAATFNVSKTADTADGVCNADCSLREAISAANGSPGLDTVSIPAGTFRLVIQGGDNSNAVGDFDITDDVIVRGAGRNQTIVDGQQLDRVFDVHDATTTFRDLTVQNGNKDSCGGGIRAEGDTTFERVDIRNNRADFGGGLCVETVSTVIDSTFDGNTANDWGGAVDNAFATLYVFNSTFLNNSARADGGAICNDDGTLEVTNSTFTRNHAEDGSVIWNDGSAIFRSSTLYDNGRESGETAIWSTFDAPTTLENSVLMNSNAGWDCIDPNGVVSNGYNIESGTTCGLTNTGDMQNANALLGPLADNGGPTMTHALLAGSPAIDAGTPSNCPANDQRGESRPSDGDGNGSAECDIGAFEVQSSAAASPDIVPLFGDSIGVLPDFNGNDAPEVLHLNQNGIIGTEIRDSGLGTPLGEPTFLGQIFSSRQVIGFADSGGPVVAASSVAPAAGSPQSVIAVLAVNNGTNEIIVQIRDAQTGARRANVYFLGSNFAPVRMAHVPDMNGNGADEIALLAIRNSDNAFLVQVRDSLTGDRLQNAYYLGPAYEPLDLVVIPDTDGDGAFEIGVLAKERVANARFLVQVRNAMGPPAPRNLFYLGPTFSPRSVLLVPDSDADGVPEIGVLALKKSDGRVLVQVRDAFGSPDPRNIFVLGLNYSPLNAVAMDDADGDGAPEIAVLARRNTDSKIAVDVRNVVAPRNPRLIFFMDSTFRAEALIVGGDRDGNGIPDLGVLGKRNSDDRRRIQFKNARGSFGTRDIWLSP